MSFVLPSDTVNGLMVDPSVKTKLLAVAASASPCWLRVAVLGGGCSGFQYEIKLDAPTAEDKVLSFGEGVGVLVDDVSAPFLTQARLVFVSDLMGERFVVENPNATASCGCGLSFAV